VETLWVRVAQIVGLGALCQFGTAVANDDETRPEVWQRLAQEEMVRLHSHFDWMGTETALLDDAADWPRSSPPYHLEALVLDDFDIPIVVNSAVKRWMDYYLGPGRRTFEIYLARSARYETMIRAELGAAGVPQDLVYLAMIESGFVSHAVSGAGAVGLWQIMPGTAGKIDVRVDGWVDDRLDPIRSTQGAATLLKTLHERWGDWYLAWAAYNAGGRRVKQGIEVTGSSDFWQLGRSGVFAGETAQYVPKLIAAAILGKYRERYGFTELRYLPALSVERVDLAGRASLKVLAECADQTLPELRALNPGFLRDQSPKEGHPLSLPVGRKTAFLTCLEDRNVYPPQDPDPENGGLTTHYSVQWGDTLSSIALRYGVRVGQLRTWNRIEPGALIKVGQALNVVLKGRDWLKYTVRDGDNLGKIAMRHACTVKDLLIWNGLNGSFLRPGQQLQIKD